MRHKLLKFLILILLIGIGFAAWWFFKTEKNEPVLVYEPVRITHQPMEKTIEATATVEPRNRIEINPTIDGRIDEVFVTEGQHVKKGDIVVTMSSTERAALLDAARAKGDDVLKEWEDIYKATSLIAPLEGTIILRDTEPGQTVSTSDAILALSDRLIVTAQVDETDIGSIKVGQRVHITLDAYNDIKISGEVTSIAFEATTVNNVTIYEVEVNPDVIPDCMKSGMTATAAFIIASSENALTLPAGAISSINGQQFVFVQNESPTSPPMKVLVKTGISSNGNVEIISGLDGNERVVKKSFSIKRNTKEEASSPLFGEGPGGGNPPPKGGGGGGPPPGP